MIRRLALPPGLFLAFILGGCADEPTAPGSKVRAFLPSAAVAHLSVTGQIAFASLRDGNGELYKMDHDGSNQTRLTNHPGGDFFPTWALDGIRLAFTSDRDGNSEIYTMNARCPSQAPRRLTNNGVLDTHPTWSTDGSQIAFVSERDGPFRQIYVMNADGSGATNLSNVGTPSIGVYTDEQPRWSAPAVNNKIAFSRSGGAHAVGEVYVMTAFGLGKTNLTNHPANDAPLDWSPDNSKILFASNRDHSAYELYVMNADGSGVVRLTNNTVSEYPASWSRNGTKIAFNIGGDVYTMNAADGSNQVNVTNTVAADGLPDWGVAAPPLPPGMVDGDCDGIADAIDTAPTTFAAANSAAFSDVPLGGATPGFLFNRSENAFYTVEDVAAPLGVRVTVTSPSVIPRAQAVFLRLNNKDGTLLLRGGGSYVITDPQASVTVAVEQGGLADIEFTLNGSPVVISIADGASATITETTDANGVLQAVTVSGVTGNAGDVTLDGAPLAPGGPPVTLPPPLCSDGIDNDGDGKTDWPDDPDCYRGSDDNETVRFIAGLNNSSGDNRFSLTLAAPVVSEGDLLVAQVVVSKDVAQTEVICAPPGWQLAGQTKHSNTGRSKMNQAIFYSAVTASQASTPHTWTFRQGNCSGPLVTRARGAAGGIIRYSGVDVSHASGPVDTFAGTGTGSSSSTLATAPDVTTTTDGAHVIRFFAAFKATNFTPSSAPPSVYSIASTNNGSERTAAAFDAVQGSAGATGPFTAGIGSSAEWLASTIALRMLPVP